MKDRVLGRSEYLRALENRGRRRLKRTRVALNARLKKGVAAKYCRLFGREF
jgi:hypothetical protein